ncbi:MAG: polysaccharide pyruvyl transferase family protein [Bacteroidota bacterium]
MSTETKFGIISYPDSRNRGDEVQSLAAKGLLPRVDYMVPRDSINTFKTDHGGPVKLLCNGWFTTTPTAWPPSPDIEPLILSFHVTNSNTSPNNIFRPELKEYYQKWAPIGGRDMDTAANFQKLGVDAYFSGCVTLTLKNKFSSRNDDILIVDPFYQFNYDKAYMQECVDILVPDAYKSKVKYLTHRIEKDAPKETVEEKFKKAQALLDQYAQAKMVITSRIHVALPCLAMGTPVYFMDIGYNTPKDRDRFNGIINLFNTISDEYFPMPKNRWYNFPFRKLKFYKFMKHNKNAVPIDWENPKPNKDLHLPIREALIKRVNAFIEA